MENKKTKDITLKELHNFLYANCGSDVDMNFSVGSDYVSIKVHQGGEGGELLYEFLKEKGYTVYIDNAVFEINLAEGEDIEE